jgi:hypothetical protein
MRAFRPFVIVLLCGGCASPPREPTLALTHVTVVDVPGGGGAGQTIPDQNVIIRGRRIVSMGNASDTRVPRGAQVMEGRGKYLIPGLWDMHVHLDSADLPALVQLGITGARDMGGDLEQLLSWRRRIAAGEITGPRLVIAGPLLRGPRAFTDSGPWVIRSAAQGIRAVDSLAARHVDFIKVHEGLSRVAYFAIGREVHARHLSFVGHVPAALSPQTASDAGQRSIEHLEFLPDACLPGRPSPPCTQEDFDSLAAHLVKNGTWLDPTIGSFRIFAPQLFPAILAGFRDLVPLLRARQIGLLAGTDLGTTGIIPGVSLHDELALLVDAGFTPAEALRAATLNPAEFLGFTDSLGTIESGKIADLVLLDQDPLADIHNTRRIAAVIREGRVVVGRWLPSRP